MSESATPTGGVFDYTQRSYWGGPWYRYWTLMLITVFGGFFGLDHVYLRSPVTGMLKFVLNILSLGLWYVYDLLQIFGEQDSVMKHGLSIPIFGAAGIGSGMFVDDQPTATPSKSPLRYLAYLMLVWLPFGFDMYIAGDTNGALAKFMAAFFMILWPISLLWSALTIGKAYFTPRAIFEQGTTRMFPFSWVMDANGRSVLGPKDVPTPEDGDTCDPGGINGVFSSIIGTITGILSPLFQAVVNVVLPGLVPATTAATTAVQAGATAATKIAESSGELASAVIDAAKNPAAQSVGMASTLVQKAPEALAAGPSLVSGVTGKLNKFTTPEGLKELAQKQAGGGDGGDPITSGVLFLFFMAVLASGSYFAATRLNLSSLLFRSKKNGQERNDSPPKPHGL